MREEGAAFAVKGSERERLMSSLGGEMGGEMGEKISLMEGENGGAVSFNGVREETTEGSESSDLAESRLSMLLRARFSAMCGTEAM